jgi:MFS transporter, DHA1 family, multidrug resistance protein
MLNTNITGIKASSFAALALAFASFGDAFLYPFLPMNFASVGIPVAWVGVLLSINRFIRILSNTLIVHAFAKYGLRVIMILAVCLAISSTFGYGIATGIFGWILFRILWGLSFSAMRIGTLAYALQYTRQGLALGVSRSLQELGPMLALLLAPLLITHLDSKIIFYTLAVLSLPALYFAWALPNTDDKTQPLQGRQLLRWPSTLNSMTLISAIVIDGVMVVVLGVLFVRYGDQLTPLAATALAAFYLGYRRMCLVLLSAFGGWLADRLGMERIFNVSMMMVVVGLIAIVFGWVALGAIVVFTFYSINAAITPGSASKQNINALTAVAANATWRDIGAAVGTLFGGLLLTSAHVEAVLVFGTLVLMILLLAHIGAGKKTFKYLYLWK